MNHQLWSWLLMAVGVTGLYLAGKRSWTGWAIGLAGQFLWLAYSLVTEQWGFLASCFVYGAVYIRNLRAWLHPTPPATVQTTPAPVPVRSTVDRGSSVVRSHSGPVRCLSASCPRPATHWHDGAPWCLPCADRAITDEGRCGVDPVPGTDADFAAYYLTRDLNPALRSVGQVS
ncbi:hypothetical protein [Micromonospora sp. WMMD712]|uniref:hypothetical protein n=1 Tax=Micromonospora sp. WMMD712 TaxID=3016096 RepID=UPI00249CBDE3|nr:hypothetical protein [Micromonospora sp. WMMD712]WFE60816.1 hypothetical protein O7633_30065 [Micromonospora sp. WMMD712]